MLAAGFSSSNHTHPRVGADNGAADTVRMVVRQLEKLEPQTARYLAGLAFILTRVADADQQICGEETQRIEGILREYACLPEEQAVLMAEIAKHRTRSADCASSYGVSRELRRLADNRQRSGLLGCLFAVALADGRVTASERAAIRQIAAELGFSGSEVDAVIAEEPVS